MLVLFFLLLLLCGCSSDIQDSDGNLYKTVKIGKQVWMAENLNVRTEKGSWCYANKPENCEKYGRLYTWVSVMAFPDSCYDRKCESLEKHPHQGICPDGFHVPSNDEFNELYDYVGGIDTAGMKLKSKNGWEGEDSSDFKSTDEFGFNMLAGGYLMWYHLKRGYVDKKDFMQENFITGLWTCSSTNEVIEYYTRNAKDTINVALVQSFATLFEKVLSLGNKKGNGFYLRCVKD